MAILQYENQTGGATAIGIQGVLWAGQSFTPSTTHAITHVILKLFRTLSPGTLDVSIRATDGGGLPTGADLCSGSIDGNSLTTDSAGATYQIDFTTTPYLTSSVKYAIVLRAVSGDVSNFVSAIDNLTDTYAGGVEVKSTDSGVIWTAPVSTTDLYFEEWGIAIDATTAAFFAILDDESGGGDGG